MKKIVACSIFLLSIQSSFAQFNKSKMDSVMSQLDSHQKAMASIALSENGHSIYSKSIGYADVSAKKVANETTMYHIGSITKMFTAVLIFQLIEEHKLSLDTKLSTFFPSLPNSAKITIAQLLNHHSGLFNFTRDTSYTRFMENPMTHEALIAMFEKQTPSFEPNEKGDYSNTNYVVLTMILEKITKSKYSDLVQTRICKKIQLSHTKVATKINTANNEAQSYSLENKIWKQETQTDMSIPLGAGCIESTPNDLCTFITALFSNKLISTSSLEAMKTIEDGYGKGMFKMPFGKKVYYGHTGGIDGFEAMLTYIPEAHMACAITSNGMDYELNNLAIAALSIYFNEAYTVPNFDAVPNSNLKTCEGTYTCARLGMDIIIKSVDGNLTAQATNQSAFTLEKVSDVEYKYDQAGIQILFTKETDGNIKTFQLNQSGGHFAFEKQ